MRAVGNSSLFTGLGAEKGMEIGTGNQERGGRLFLRRGVELDRWGCGEDLKGVGNCDENTFHKKYIFN